MAIVLEGPDNSGKSTLAKRLSRETGWPIVHSGGPGKVEDFAERLLKDIDNMQRNVIMDRSFIISDSIYSPACRQTRLFDPRPWFRKIQALDQIQSNFLLVFCTAPTSVLLDMSTHIVKPHETREHVAHVMQNKEQICREYDMFYQMFSAFCDPAKLDPRKDTEDFIFNLDNVVQWRQHEIKNRN